MNLEEIRIKRKRLIFRSWHRGMREMDLLLGRFADAFVPEFDEGELIQYEQILSYSDPDLYNWISGREEASANIINPVFERLLDFSFKKPGPS